MSNKNLSILLFAFLLLTNCQPTDNKTIDKSINKFADQKIVRIHELKDQRETDSLVAYLAAKNAKYRNEAALALASVGDSNAVNALSKNYVEIVDNSPEQANKQKLIALALLQSYGRLGYKKMLVLYESAVNSEVRGQILTIIGKCGAKNKKMTQFITAKSLENWQSEGYKIAMLKGFYEFFGRKYYSPEMLEIALELANENESEAIRQMAAAYLARLNRIKDQNLETLFYNNEHKWALQLIDYVKTETNALVKMNLVLALGLFENMEKTALINSELTKENDYRVVVNLFNATLQNDYDSLKEIASTFVGNNDNLIEMAAANFFLKNGKAENIDYYKNLLGKCQFWRSKNILLAALLNTQENQNTPEINLVITNALLSPQNEFDAAEMYQLLAANQEWAPILLDFYKKEASETAKTYCLDALGKIATNYVYTDLNQIVQRIKTHLINALSAKNGFRVYTAAMYLQNNAFQFDDVDSIKTAVYKAIENWPIPKYFETKLELEKLKRKLNNEPFEDFKLENPFNNAVDWNYVQAFSPKQKLKIQTNKGDIIIELDIENAPASVAYIAKLAQSGFYNNLIWHRVLSNFVIQGGDPERNGTGGAEGSLRSEHSFNSYKEGAVGLASAGKDTESCQFFITHNATPNLDGRYTIIGYVIEGMDVVHKIQVNDKILKVELL